jgi:hypothetical protein
VSSVLVINGSTVNRTTARVVLNRLSISMDGPDTLEWTQYATTLPGTYRTSQSVTLTVDGTLVFTGVIVSLHPTGINTGQINVGYRAMGLNWLANQVFITAADGSGKMTFNLPQTDPSYIASQSGLNVGQILTALYNQHATQLSALGITSFNSSDLANLTVVPPDPVVFTGRLWNAARSLVTQYHNKYGAWVTPAGVIRHENLLTLPTTTFTLDALDGSGIACSLGSISEDFSECYTAVTIRGADNVQGAYLSLVDGTLLAGWTSTQQNAWNYSQFIFPPGAYETGTISSMTGTTLSVTATNPIPITYTSTTHWSALDAEVWAYNTVATSAAFGEQRRVTSITVPSGNTYTLTVDAAFANSGYTNYQIRGLAAFQSNTTAVQVWRKFLIKPTYVAQHLVQQFSHSVPWSGTDGVLVQTMTGMSDICFTQAGENIEWPMSFTIIPWGTGVFTTQATVTATISSGHVTGFTGLTGGSGYPPSSTSIAVSIQGVGSGATATATSNASGVITAVTLGSGGTGYSVAPTVLIGISDGYILFDQPICTAYCSQAVLNAGGSGVPAPTDIKVLVPFSAGTLTAVAPSSGFQGTAYTVNGLQRTQIIDYPSWLDYGDQAEMNALAQEKLDCVKNTVVEGTLTYYGKQSTFLLLGQALNITGNGYTTGYEAITAQATSVVLDYCSDGGAASWQTQIGFSTRLKPYTGDRVYRHASQAARDMGGGGLGFGMAAGLAAAGTSAAAFSGAGLALPADDSGGNFANFDQPAAANAPQGRQKPTPTPTATPKSDNGLAEWAADFGNQVLDTEPDAATAAQDARRDRAQSHGSLREARGIPAAATEPDQVEQPAAPSTWTGYDDSAQGMRRQRAEDDGQ